MYDAFLFARARALGPHCATREIHARASMRVDKRDARVDECARALVVVVVNSVDVVVNNVV